MEVDEKRGKGGGRESVRVLPLAFELGFTIAIPIVVFALLGRLADRAFGTSPWLLLTGILLSIALSTRLIYRRISPLL